MPTSEQLLAVISIQSEIAKHGFDLGAVMSLVVDQVLPLIDADGAAIELAEGDDMVYRACSGIAAGMIGLHLKVASSLSGLCVRTGESLRCDDCDTDDRVDRDACRKIGLRSMIVMPLRHNGQTVGALKAMSKQPAKFSESDVRVLNLISDAVGSAMYFAAKYDMEELFRRATHDGLTGLANRALFMDHMRSMIAQSARDQRAAAVLMIDMDGLKQVNDTFGHRAGDAIIAEFANRIRSAARASDTVARLGGDEFGVILVPVDVPEGIDAAVQRLTHAIAPPFEFEGRMYQLRASIGAARFPHDGDDINALVEVADQRMYAEKRERKSGRS